MSKRIGMRISPCEQELIELLRLPGGDFRLIVERVVAGPWRVGIEVRGNSAWGLGMTFDSAWRSLYRAARHVHQKPYKMRFTLIVALLLFTNAVRGNEPCQIGLEGSHLDDVPFAAPPSRIDEWAWDGVGWRLRSIIRV